MVQIIEKQIAKILNPYKVIIYKKNIYTHCNLTRPNFNLVYKYMIEIYIFLLTIIF